MTGGVPDSGGGLGRAAFLNGGQGTGRRIYPLWTKADSPNAGGKRQAYQRVLGNSPKDFYLLSPGLLCLDHTQNAWRLLRQTQKL